MNDAVRLPVHADETAGPSHPPVDGGALTGVRRRRVFAWAVDVAICALFASAAAIPATLLGLISFGVLWAPAWLAVGLIPLAYNAILVSGVRRSTWGQRLVGLRLETPGGGAAGLLQAAVHFVVFYLSVAATGGLVLLWTFFNSNKSLLHDIVANLQMRRALPGGDA